METTTKGLRLVPLFTDEANRILSQSLHLQGSSSSEAESKHLTTVARADVSQPCHVINTADSSTSHVTNVTSHVIPSQDRHCQSCHAPLATRAEQVAHYQLDWHRYNLKRRLKGHPPVSQEEFEIIAGDLSSISGSESSSSDSAEEEKEEEEGVNYVKSSGSPLLQFVAQDGAVYAVYRSVITNSKALPAAGGKEEVEEEEEEVGRRLCALREAQVWVVLMRAGGHFAGAVFNRSEVVAHKTFHRYTVRAKRGTAQSVRDSQQGGGGHQPKSAGATLRRYNEQALVQEIQQLIASWAKHIEGATAIFIRTPKYSKGALFSSRGSGGQAPISKDDPRIRGIPFATRRPTLKEVKSVHSKLAALYTGFTRSKPVSQEVKSSQKSLKVSSARTKTKQTLVEFDEENSKGEGVAGGMDGPIPLQRDGGEERASDDETTVQKRRKRKGGKSSNKTTATEAPEKPKSSFPDHIQRLVALCVDGGGERAMEDAISSVSPLTAAAEEEGAGSVDRSNQFVELSDELSRLWDGETLLHQAAVNGRPELVSWLLQHGANPAVKNASGHMPYFVAKDKLVRDTFRRFMAGNPGRYDYDAAGIPSALTEEMERERRERQQEKKRAQRKARKHKEKERRAEREVEAVRETQQQASSALSERERRAMAAERRLASQLPQDSTIARAGGCEQCGRSLAGVVPFERLRFKYCSMSCLKQHRALLSTAASS